MCGEITGNILNIFKSVERHTGITLYFVIGSHMLDNVDNHYEEYVTYLKFLF